MAKFGTFKYSESKYGVQIDRGLYLLGKDISYADRGSYLSGLITTYVDRGIYLSGDNHERYWVGGTGNWSSTDHWAYTSGGSSGVPIPTSSDDVFIDANSGFGSGGTITLDVEAYLHDLTCSSGHNYTIDGIFNFWCYGDAVFESGITYSLTGEFVLSGNESRSITTNSCVLCNFSSSDDDYTGEATLLDDLKISGTFYFGNGSFDANYHDITANDFFFYADTGYTPIIYMGSGVWESTNNGSNWDSCWFIDEYSGEVVTIYPETSTIKLSGEGSDPKVFYHYDDIFTDLGKTYNNIWITGEGTGSFTIQGSNTFNEFKVDTPPHTVLFETGKTTTVSTWDVVGSDGNLITLDADTTNVINLVTNGTFDSDLSGWVNEGAWYWSAGTGSALIDSTVNYLKQTIDIEDGKTYNVSFDFSHEAGNVYVQLGDTGTPYEVTSPGSINIQLVAGVDEDASIIFTPKTGFAVVAIDNVIVTESQFTLSKSSGVVDSDYLDISNSNATGGASWYAGEHSVDTANNDGWLWDNSADRGIHLSGKALSNADRDLYIIGKSSSTVDRSLYLSGKILTSQDRGLYIIGGLSSSSDRSIYIVGGLSNTTDRGIYLSGITIDYKDRGIYLTGSFSSTADRGIYLSGVSSSSTDRGIYIAGIGYGAEDRGLYLSGINTTFTERGIYLTGGITATADRGIYVSGIVLNTYDRGIYVVGRRKECWKSRDTTTWEENNQQVWEVKDTKSWQEKEIQKWYNRDSKKWEADSKKPYC